MICGTGLDPLQNSDEFPFAVCRTGVGSNIIFWNSCKHWVHKIAESSSAWQRTLITDVHSARELHAAWTADHRGKSDEPIKLGIVAFSCYLGDMLSAADGCELSITTCVKTAWKFKELLPVLFQPTHFQEAWPRVQLVCRLQCSMPMRLGHLESQTANICSKITGQ